MEIAMGALLVAAFLAQNLLSMVFLALIAVGMTCTQHRRQVPRRPGQRRLAADAHAQHLHVLSQCWQLPARRTRLIGGACRATWRLVCLPILGALLVLRFGIFVGLPPFLRAPESASLGPAAAATQVLQAAILAGELCRQGTGAALAPADHMDVPRRMLSQQGVSSGSHCVRAGSKSRLALMQGVAAAASGRRLLGRGHRLLLDAAGPAPDMGDYDGTSSAFAGSPPAAAEPASSCPSNELGMTHSVQVRSPRLLALTCRLQGPGCTCLPAANGPSHAGVTAVSPLPLQDWLGVGHMSPAALWGLFFAYVFTVMQVGGPYAACAVPTYFSTLLAPAQAGLAQQHVHTMAGAP